VPTATEYVNDPALVKRDITAQPDLNWSAHASIAAAIATVQQIDPRLALQLEVMFSFGLRRKEAVTFSSALAELSEYALPAEAAPGTRYLMFICVKRDTKGGRGASRPFAAISSAPRWNRPKQRRAAHLLTRSTWPSLKQALARFDFAMRRAGITRDKLGITRHGLRQEVASNLSVNLAALPLPIAGGACGDVELINAAYLKVARQLGHNRSQISGAYLGGRRGPLRTDAETERTLPNVVVQRRRTGLHSWERPGENGAQLLPTVRNCAATFARSVAVAAHGVPYVDQRRIPSFQPYRSAQSNSRCSWLRLA
jgi:hypothetical protein